jgi:eukaryotic-like serine/threonine-protein kinase
MEITKLGRYEITGTLGQGAMGVVYSAHDPLLDRVVAIKTINMSLEQEEIAEYGARFEQEAKAAGGLNHPNIITIYDVGSSGNVAYMAMEYLEGRELRHMLVGGNPLPTGIAIDIAAQVAEGLAYAHERHVVHRDIKPANIMVVTGNRAKITDFGIARMRSSQVKTMTGMVMGSPKYMSPEQVMGQRADGRSDIFSVGVMLYEMLTGTAPFSGETITSLMFQVLNVNPAPPRQLVALIPEMLNFVVAKALAKKADDRYQNAMDLANDLRECARQLAQAQAQSGSQPLAVAPTADAAPPPRADEKTEIVDPTKLASRTRFDDTQQMGEEAPPARGVSKTFDSYAATMKVASRTGMTAKLDEFAKTQQVSRTGSHEAMQEAALLTTAVTQPVPVIEPVAGAGAERSGKHAAAASSPVAELLQKVKAHEEAALIAGVVAALVLAALIIFV